MLTIGQIASAAAVNVQTVRYYERRGLLLATRRTAAGYRQYDDEQVRRIRFIKHAQRLGFSLHEIQELLALRVRNGSACAAVERKTRAKIDVIESKMAELDRLKHALEHLAVSCRARRTTPSCPVLAALEEADAAGCD
ncbi:MAG: MerR family DNA-binding protein [Gemmatimonadaceae bacterium]